MIWINDPEEEEPRWPGSPPAREAALEKETPGASPAIGRKGIRTDGRTKL